MPALSSWNAQREEMLAKLWADGLSARQIASCVSRLPGPPVTRNAVIGKRIRMGLPDRGPTRPRRGKSTSGRRTQPLRKPRKVYLSPEQLALAKLRTETFRAEPDLVIPEDERRMLVDLEPGDCRWGFGDPKTPAFHFCNRLQVGTQSRTQRGVLPYCDWHSRRAFQLPAPRVSRTPLPSHKKESVDA